MKLVGWRKFVLGMTYLVFMTGLAVIALLTEQSLTGVIGMCGAAASGLLIVIYGNVKEHQVKNGGKT